MQKPNSIRAKRKLTYDEVLREVKRRLLVDAEFREAVTLKVSKGYFTDILQGRRVAGDSVLRDLGYDEKKYYTRRK